VTELKVKRKINVLLLIQVAAQPDIEVGVNPDFGGPVLIGNGGVQRWRPDFIAEEIAERLKESFPIVPAKGYEGELWYVKSVKEAIAP
jgi:hypothetical protein